jgi:exonuclease III
VRFVSWNMARNTFSGPRHERAWHYLRALDADIALVQEAMPPPWALEHWDIVRADVPRWGTAIVARKGLGVHEMADLTLTSHDQGGLLATASLTLPDATEFLIGSVHAPLPTRFSPLDLAGYEPEDIWLPAYRKAFYYDVPFAIYRERTQGRRFLVSGDWNVSPRLWDRHHPRDHEQQFFVRAAAAGWVDCYDLKHPDEEEGRTWFRGDDLPYQIDHAFCDPLTAVSLTSCDIDPSPATFLAVSDHAPLILDLAIS